MEVSRLWFKNRELHTRLVRQDHTFTQWVDSLGKIHAQTKAPVITYNELSPEDKVKINDAAMVLRVKPKDVKSYTEVATSTSGKFEEKPDTNGTLLSTDGHLTIFGVDTTVKPPTGYLYEDTAKVAFFTKHKRLLGISFSKQDMLDVTFSNPNTKIVGLTNINLGQHITPKRFGLGVQAGYSYINGYIRPYVGAGISYNFIRW